MFADGFLLMSLEGLLGLIVTALGVWLIVRQLNETRLASQMEGIISLVDKEQNMVSEATELLKFTETEKWTALSDKAAYFHLQEGEDKYWGGYMKVFRLYELVGALVRSNALDESAAFESFGFAVPLYWGRLGKVVRGARFELNSLMLGEHWEWLANKFEKEAERRHS